MNYTELTDLIQKYCEYEEADFVATIPQFIRNAEERICREVFLPNFRKTATATMTASSRFLSTPSDFLYPYYLAVTSGTEKAALLNKEPDWILEAYTSTSAVGLPKFYALHNDSSILLGPTPDQNYACELGYNYQPTSIVVAGNTWLGTNAQVALLYGCLYEASLFMRQDQDIKQEYESMFQDGLNQLEVFGGVRSRKDDYRKRDKRRGLDE